MARATLGKQKRTRRATLLMTPDEYEGLSILAQLTDKTVNDFCMGFLSALVKENKKIISAFKEKKREYVTLVSMKSEENLEDRNYNA